MTRISTTLREKLIDQLDRMYSEMEDRFPNFLAEARRLLPRESGSRRFGFIVRRLWMNFGGEPPSSWKRTLSKRYRDFDTQFDWGQNRDQWEDWISSQRVEKTLSVYQRHYSYKLSVPMAVEKLTVSGEVAAL